MHHTPYHASILLGNVNKKLHESTAHHAFTAGHTMIQAHKLEHSAPVLHSTHNLATQSIKMLIAATIQQLLFICIPGQYTAAVPIVKHSTSCYDNTMPT